MTESPSARNEKIGRYLKSGRRGQGRRGRQIEEYVTWINSHLKKKPGTPPISDLKSLLDGTTLVNLVEILSQRKIARVEREPASEASRMNNVETVIAFLKDENVSLPESALKDLNECDVKGLLKIVLSIAEHYNPLSIRRSAQPLSSGHTSGSSSPHINICSPFVSEGIAQDTDHTHQLDHALPTDHVLIRPIKTSRRESAPIVMTSSSYRPNSTPLSLTTTPKTFIQHGKPNPLLGHTHQGGMNDPPGGESSGGVSPIPSSIQTKSMARDTPISGLTGVVSSVGIMKYTDSMISPPTGSSGDISPAVPPIPTISDGPITQIDGAMSEVNGLKGEVLQLFNLLKENHDGPGGEVPEMSHSVLELIGQNNHNHLNPLPEEVPELQQLRDDITTLHSECTILQSVVDEKEDLVRQLKSDILRLDYKSETEKGELRNIISEKQLVIEELDIRVAERDKVVEDQATKISELEEELLELNKAQEDYRRQYEDKVTELQELKQTTLHRSSSRLLHPELVTTEAEVVRISISSLRRDCGPAQQSSLDHLEQSVARLMDHMSAFTKKSKHDHSRHKEEQRERRHKKSSAHEDPSKSYGTMKVMFIMDNDPTPYRINVALRTPNGPVLGDFKRSLGKKGNFTYYFRSNEEGSVMKVELTEDTAVLPMVDGKIMAWVYSS